jgi:hypothetical protein
MHNQFFDKRMCKSIKSPLLISNFSHCLKIIGYNLIGREVIFQYENIDFSVINAYKEFLINVEINSKRISF